MEFLIVAPDSDSHHHYTEEHHNSILILHGLSAHEFQI